MLVLTGGKTIPLFPGSGSLRAVGGTVPAYLAALEGPSFVGRLRALKAFGAMGTRAGVAVDAIAGQLLDDGLRIHAIAALGKIGAPAKSIVAKLRVFASDTDEEIREAVATAIYRITGDTTDSALRLASLLATGQSTTARMHAACHLGEMRAELAVPVLIESVTDAHHGVRQQAAYALGRIGAPAMNAVPVLVKAIESHGDDGVRFNAAVAIGRIDAEIDFGVPILMEVLSPAGSLRIANGAGFALAKKHPAQRAMAAEALGELGVRAVRAIPLLSSCSTDDSKVVRAAARIALERIGMEADTDPPFTAR